MSQEDTNPWPDGTGSPEYEASKPILLKALAERRRICEEVDKFLLDRALKETGKFVRNLWKENT